MKFILINNEKFVTNSYDIMPDTFISKLTHVSDKYFKKSNILNS